jgi:hypothetical protein
MGFHERRAQQVIRARRLDSFTLMFFPKVQACVLFARRGSIPAFGFFA